MINLAYKFRDNTKIKNLNAMYLSKLSHRLREARMVSCLIRLTYTHDQRTHEKKISK